MSQGNKPSAAAIIKLKTWERMVYMVYFVRTRTGPEDLGLLEAIMCQRSGRKGQYRNLCRGTGLKSQQLSLWKLSKGRWGSSQDSGL